MDYKDPILELATGRWLDRFAIGKTIFLIQQESNLLNDSLDFQSTWSGPYSAEVYKSVDFLISADLLKSNSNGKSTGQLQEYKSSELERYYKDFVLDGTARARAYQDCDLLYTATTKGIKITGTHISDSDGIEICRFINRIDGISSKALARYIYLQYPESVDTDHHLVHYPMG